MNSRHSVFLLSFILAFCSFSYEIILAFVVAKITGHDILSQTISIGSFIVGLGLGAFYIEKRPQNNKAGFLLNIEILLSLVGGLGVFFVFAWDAFLTLFLAKESFLLFFIPVQLYIVIIGFLSGLELPNLLDEKFEENKVLGFHYFGTLVSSLLIFSWFIPQIDVLNTVILIAYINLMVGLYLYLKSYQRVQSLLGLSAVSILLVLLMLFSAPIYNSYLKVFYFQPSLKSFSDLSNVSRIIDLRPDVRRYRSKYQYIDFIDDNEKGDPSLIMYLDHRKQFSSTHEHIYHEQMVHIPMQLTSNAKNILVLGGGDGLIVRELLKYNFVQQVTLVELDQDVLNFATTDLKFLEINQNSLSDGRVKIIVNDAISFIRKNKVKYDAVFLDFPYPNNYDLAKLYSLEFYKAVKSSMTENAFMVLDYPIDKYAAGSSFINEVILSTLEFAGFQNNFVYGEEDTFVLSKFENSNIDRNTQFRFLSERAKKELLFRDDVIQNTKINKSRVNSLFKPQTLQIRRTGW